MAQLDENDTYVNLMDVYDGPAMQDIPRGSIKQLRVFTYHFAFQRQAGITHRVGADGPWEVKKVLGTVPVEEDGYFVCSVQFPSVPLGLRFVGTCVFRELAVKLNEVEHDLRIIWFNF